MAAAPPMVGAEYLTTGALHALWTAIAEAFAARLGGIRSLGAGRPARVRSRLEHGRARALPPRREPQGPRARRSPSWPRTRTASRRRGRRSTSRSARPFASTPARPTRRGCSRCSCRCSARRERCVWLKEMVDEGEIFHPLALDAARGAHPPPRRARAGGRGRRRARAGALEGRPATAARASPRTVGAKAPSRPRPRRAARLPRGGDARRREPLTPAEVRALLAGDGRPRLPARPVGRGRSRAAAAA